MIKLLVRCLALVSALALAAPAHAREFSLRAQCFDEVGELAVTVIDSGPFAGSILVGIVHLTDGTEFQREDLRFIETRRLDIWQGEWFLLRVHLDKPVASDRYLGRFRGRDDWGRPVAFRNLSCALFDL
jgi:hypothetical protein